MLLLSHQKKIVLVAISLFFVSLSMVFVMTGESGENHASSMTNSVLGSFFDSHSAAETSGGQDHKNTAASLVIAKTGEVLSLNTAFTSAFGYEKSDLMNDIYSLFHSDDLSSFVRDFTKFSQEKSPKEMISGPFRFLTKSSDYHLVLLTFLTEKHGIHIDFKDITQSVQDLDKKSDSSSSGKKIQDLQEKDGTRIVVEKLK
ncbi:MAG: PAS domain-containing protein [Patescibacteria group bacterium]